MNRYSIVTIIAIVAIIAPFANWALTVIGIPQLEYRWDSPGEFTFFAMSNHGKIEFCNTVPFWMSLEKLDVTVFFEGNNLGTFSTNPVTINPLTSAVQEGVFSSDELSASQHVFMTLDFEFDGGDIRLDPNQLVVITSTNTPILGIIPYATSTQISGFDFDQKMNSEDLTCD